MSAAAVGHLSRQEDPARPLRRCHPKPVVVAATASIASNQRKYRFADRCNPRQQLHLRTLRPEASPPRGRKPDRAGALDRPGLRGRWASRVVLARVAPAIDLPRERQRRGRRYGRTNKHPGRLAGRRAAGVIALWPCASTRSTRKNTYGPSGVTAPRTRGEALLGLQQPTHHHQLAHQVIQGLAGGLPVRIGDRP